MNGSFSFFSRIANWFGRRPKQVAPPPMLKLNEHVPALATKEGSNDKPYRMTLSSFNLDQLCCKSHELLPERTLLRLVLTLPGGTPVTLRTYIEWVDISSFGHSMGMRILHDSQSRQMVADSLRYVERGNRHSKLRTH